MKKWDLEVTLKPNERKTTTEVQEELKAKGINCIGVKVDTMKENLDGSKTFTLEITEGE